MTAMSEAPDSSPIEPDASTGLMLREQYLLARGKTLASDRRQRSIARCHTRTALRPDVATHDDALPINAHRDEIIAALRKHQVLVVSGETGSGKTTQLPRFALAAGFGRRGMIGHTQPRRLAARSVASRIAEETALTLGKGVGYTVRFDDHSSPDTLVRLMTDGILLNELQQDRLLLDYEVLIIDEAHERSLNIDFLLGVLALLVRKRPELKVIVTSATIDHQRFSAHFDDAPVIEVSGRGYPVEIAYTEEALDGDDSRKLARAVCDAVSQIQRRKLPKQAQDILVFLPGEREIRDAERALLRSGLLPETGWEVLPLFGRLSDQQQNAVFRNATRRRVVLATNVAETSLTVPKIGAVIDSGLARVNRYSHRSRIQRLQLEAVSQASANQRAGRCGRIGPGFCLRLYSQAEFDARSEFTDAEILRNNLASVLLQLLTLRLGEPENFPFIDPPDPARIDDARRLLFELGALKDNGDLSKLGRRLGQLPLDPRLGRMLLAPLDARLQMAAIVIVAGVSVQDPRQRPLEQREQADAAHAAFADARSDFMGVLRLWFTVQSAREGKKRREFERWCAQSFLSPRRIREWQEVARQLARQLKVSAAPVDRAIVEQPPARDQLHMALLTGLLTHIGHREESAQYLGVERKRFALHPASVLSAKPPAWVMALEIVQTRKRLARYVSPIDAAWAARAGAHLIQYEYDAPYWQPRRGRVEARRTGLLFGLVVEAPKRVNFGAVKRAEARDVFITQGLVKDRVRVRAHFIEHNREQRELVRQLAGKLRRAVEISDAALAALYAARLPEHVFDAGSLKRWSGKKPKSAESLCFSQAQLMSEVPETLATQTPDQANVAGNTLAIAYQFTPGRDDDGASVTVPEALLAAVSEADLEQAVPAYLQERVSQRLRMLPKALRRQLHPIREHAVKIAEWLKATKDRSSLNVRLSRLLLREYGMQVPLQTWDGLVEADFLQPRIVVVDEAGKVVRTDRTLSSLQQEAPQRATARATVSTTTAASLSDWPAEPLPVQRSVQRGGVTLTVYPALARRGSQLIVDEFLEPIAADREHVAGIVRLAQLKFRQQFKLLRKALIAERRIQLLWSTFDDPGGQVLIDDYLDAIVLHAIPGRSARALVDIRSQADWATFCDVFAGDIVARGDAIRTDLLAALAAFAECQAQVNQMPDVYAEAVDDVNEQIAALIYPGFLSATPADKLSSLPRYLNAAVLRLQRMASNPGRDTQSMAMIASLQSRIRGAEPTLSGKQQVHAARTMRWSIEELRVSLFAQSLGTQEKVSLRRLEKRWDDILRMQD
ncbi:MAG: ATP-dependent RNA helicase HrpA [Pseudomonadota bacterium]